MPHEYDSSFLLEEASMDVRSRIRRTCVHA